MSWTPEDGWTSLALRTGVSLAAAGLLLSGVLTATASPLAGAESEQSRPVEEDPAVVQDLQRRIVDLDATLRDDADDADDDSDDDADDDAEAPAPAPTEDPSPEPVPEPAPPAGEEDSGDDGDTGDAGDGGDSGGDGEQPAPAPAPEPPEDGGGSEGGGEGGSEGGGGDGD